MPADPGGFRPPPYPYERLDELRGLAERSEVGLVDCSIGTPCDPVPQVALQAGARALEASAGYPPSGGTLELRTAAARWLGRRFGLSVDADGVAACVGTKELVVSLPRLLSLRDPARDTVLYPAISYPSYEMGATLAGCRAVPVALDHDWHLDLASVSDEDARRSLVLWVNEPGNPTASAADAAWFERAVSWARARGVILASDECYVEFAPEPATALQCGPAGVLAVHSISKRSNLAGGRIGFYAGDPELVDYLREVRKHAGLIVSTSMQAAAAAALADDEHVTRQRNEYRARRDFLMDRLGRVGLHHVGGPTAFYLWLTSAAGETGWQIARRLAEAGLLVAAGDLYGTAGADHVRVALVQPGERLAAAAEQIQPVRESP